MASLSAIDFAPETPPGVSLARDLDLSDPGLTDDSADMTLLGEMTKAPTTPFAEITTMANRAAPRMSPAPKLAGLSAALDKIATMPAPTAPTPMQATLLEHGPEETNRRLRDHGLAGLPSHLAATPEVRQALQGLFVELDRRDKQVRGLALDAHQGFATAHPSDQGDRWELKKARIAQAAAERRSKGLSEQLATVQAELSSRETKSTSSALRARNLLRHSEHRVRERDRTIDGLKAKLREAMEQEKSLREKERAVVGKLAFRGGGGSLSRSKVAEVVQAYEAQVARLQQSVAVLRAEVTSLHHLLKDRENALFHLQPPHGGERQDSRVFARGPVARAHKHDDDELFDLDNAALVKWRDRALVAARNAKTAKAREVVLRERLGRAEAALRDAEAEAAKDHAENENLRLELAARPTLRTHQTAAMRIADLEQRLHAAATSKRCAEEAAALERFLPNAERFRRDRADHRLGLGTALDTLPYEACRATLRACCRELDLSDVAELEGTIKKLCQTTHGLPRLDRFVREVCGFVFGVEAAHGRGGRRRMEELVGVLQCWRAELERCGGLVGEDARTDQVLGEGAVRP